MGHAPPRTRAARRNADRQKRRKQPTPALHPTQAAPRKASAPSTKARSAPHRKSGRGRPRSCPREHGAPRSSVLPPQRGNSLAFPAARVRDASARAHPRERGPLRTSRHASRPHPPRSPRHSAGCARHRRQSGARAILFYQSRTATAWQGRRRVLPVSGAPIAACRRPHASPHSSCRRAKAARSGRTGPQQSRAGSQRSTSPRHGRAR